MAIAQKLQTVLDIKQSIRTVLGIEPSVPFSQYPSIIEGVIEQGPSTGDGDGVLYLMPNGVTIAVADAAEPSDVIGKWHSLAGKDYYVAVDLKDLRSISSVYRKLSGGGEVLGSLTRDGETKRIPLNQVVTTFLTSIRAVFEGVASFNQDISSWDVSNVTEMDYFFYGTSFNQDISSWDVSSVTNMTSMFTRASSFNQDIGSWDVSSVSEMNYMFTRATSFNQDISLWCVSQINNAPSPFDNDTPAWTLPRPIWGTCPARGS